MLATCQKQLLHAGINSIDVIGPTSAMKVERRVACGPALHSARALGHWQAAGRGPLTCRHLGRDDFLYWRTGVGQSAETLQESQHQCRKGGAGRGELGQGSASGDLIAAQVRMAPDDVR